MDIRNVAIIAHVDHGKTTIVDFLLKQSHTFRENQEEMQQTTILDSNPLERERGITILAKNTAVIYNGVKINIIDTPGHADFSGEVERTLNMADGALLIVDAQEGPMPQTKFVLKKALELGLKIIVVINKIDKQLANIPHTLERINDLFLELATDTEHLEFPVIYAIGREGKAWTTLPEKPKVPKEPEGPKGSLSPLAPLEPLAPLVPGPNLNPIFQAIINEIPAPKAEEGSFQMLVTSLDYDSHKGKHVIGRIKRGSVKKGQNLLVIQENNETRQAKIESISITKGLEKIPVDEVSAGEIVDITGIADAGIGDTLADPADPTPLSRISIEEPTIKISLGANTSPFAGKEGKFSNSRQILERLHKELETNVSLRLDNQGDKFILSGRGELHLSVLIETLRREGYEFQVGKPEVITKLVDGVEMEPVEDVMIDVPDEFQGAVTQEFGQRRGAMTHMETDGKGNTRFEYKVPSKALLGIRSILLTKTKGTAVINTIFDTYEPLTPAIEQIRNGVLIASESGTATTYGLNNAQERGITFIEAGTKVYEGMIIGLNTRKEDMEINVVKEKKQTNIRSSTSDIAVILTPPLKMSLEQYLDFLEEDELLEVTPQNLRPRKKLLTKFERVRSQR